MIWKKLIKNNKKN